MSQSETGRAPLKEGDLLPIETLEEIRERTDLVVLAAEYVPLRKRGQNFLGLCPFHEEKSPSFSVHPTRQIYHCFGCGVGGDAFDFVARIEHTDFLGATKILAARAGVSLQDSSRDETERLRSERKREREAASKLADLERATFFHCRDELHQLERIQQLASRKGESEFVWYALADISRQMRKAAAAYTLMAFGLLERRIDFSLHPDRRETLLEDVLRAGFVSNEQGIRHEVRL